MSRKAETAYTARMMNVAAHKERKAARAARRQARAFQDYAMANANADVVYITVNGISAPVCR